MPLILSKENKLATPSANSLKIYYSQTLVPNTPVWLDDAGVEHRLGPATVKLTADGGNLTSATLADVTGLNFSVVSGTYYRISFHLIYTTTVTTSGLKWGVTTPTLTRFAGLGSTLVAADGPAAAFDGLINSSGDSVVATDAQAITADQYAMTEMTILPSANGTVQVQAANEAAAGTVVVKQGSNGILWEL